LAVKVWLHKFSISDGDQNINLLNTSPNSSSKTMLEIHFTYSGNKEFTLFLRCATESVLFFTKCCLFHNFIFFLNNIHACQKQCTKI